MRTRALADLAVLLKAPAVLGAERGRRGAGELAGQQQALVARELAREAGDPSQLLAQQSDPLDIGPFVDQRMSALAAKLAAENDRQRTGHRGLDRAAAAKRTLAVLDPRAQPLLERIGDVLATGERVGPLGAREHLQRGLAVTVFEFLAAEPVGMRGQQHLAAIAGDERHRLQRVQNAEAAQAATVSRAGACGRSRWARLAGVAGRLFGEPSGRHASMSVPVARTPPSQFVHDRLRGFDAYQRSKRRLGFAVAVIKRFSEDEASQLGALIAYYGFFSLFPLLLVFVTVLGLVLTGDPGAQKSVLHSTLSQFPIIGPQLQSNVKSLSGGAGALAIGLAGALLAGLGITGATQNAFNKIWQVQRQRRFGFFAWRLRGLAMLGLLGALSIVSTVAAGYATAQTPGAVAVVLGVAIALAANLLLFFIVFRLMSAEQIATRDLLPGIILAAVVWQILEHVGGLYVGHVVRHAKETSGLFAFVLGLLTWLYLGGQVLLLAAEVNVVRARRLWPRRLFEDP